MVGWVCLLRLLHVLFYVVVFCYLGIILAFVKFYGFEDLFFFSYFYFIFEDCFVCHRSVKFRRCEKQIKQDVSIWMQYFDTAGNSFRQMSMRLYFTWTRQLIGNISLNRMIKACGIMMLKNHLRSFHLMKINTSRRYCFRHSTSGTKLATEFL